MFKNKVKSSMSNRNELISIIPAENIAIIKGALSYSSDIGVRNLSYLGKSISIVYINTVINSGILETKIIQQIINYPKESIMDTVAIKEVHITNVFSDLVKGLVHGKTVIFIEGEAIAYLLETSSFEKRSIEEPVGEQIIRGSHDGFVENLDVNINLVRNRIKSRNLVVNYKILGRESDTRLSILYLSDVANEELIKEVEHRISFIDVDLIQSPGHLEEYLEDTTFSPFPQMLSTERPDRVTSNLMDGRIAILTDGSPTALVLPITFFAFYQTPDDYNSRWILGSFFRLIRLVSFLIAISFPAIYISIVSFHYEIIPIDLIFNIKGSLEHVPFPPLIEAMVMQTTLELLREASIRLPSPIAQTIGVVGGLVIGTAVVEANLVSNTMIVIIAITAIASFVVPLSEMGTSVRLLGFPLMLAAAFIGLIGIVFILMIILIHLCKLESFGSPYFSPFAPFRFKDLKDTFIRVPMWKMKTRPTAPQSYNDIREENTRGWENEE
jgi:spore germination protein KA